MNKKKYPLPLDEHRRMKIAEDLLEMVDSHLAAMLKEHSKWLLELNDMEKFVPGRAAAVSQIKNYLDDKKRIN